MEHQLGSFRKDAFASYLADRSVAGIRHGEIVNWTGQAIACPRSRFPELKDWSETKRRESIFSGQNEESGQDAVYVGEAEIVLDRLYSHINGKDFWTELIAFTSKDDNLTKGHVRYLESRLVELANTSARYEIEDSASPQLPSLPRADRDAMEEFINGVRTLLGVLGHRVLEPLVVQLPESTAEKAAAPSIPTDEPAIQPTQSPQPLPQSQTFQLRVSNLIATAVRTDEGLIVLANSELHSEIQSSLSGWLSSPCERMLSSGVLVENGVET